MEVLSHVVDDHNQMIIQQKSGKKKGNPFSLERYLAYLKTRDFSNFTVNHLNMVISIHGFKKYTHKKLAEEAVRAIEPTDPARSTLKEEISSSPRKASITYEETLKDIKALNWQECCITSMRSIKQDNGNDLVTLPPSIAITKSTSRKTAKKRKTAQSLMNNKTLPLMSTSSGPSKSDGSSSYSIEPVSTTKVTIKMRSRKGMKMPMLASSKSCNSGPSNSSSSDGCVSSLALVTESSN